jgi:hypothetical protein
VSNAPQTTATLVTDYGTIELERLSVCRIRPVEDQEDLVSVGGWKVGGPTVMDVPGLTLTVTDLPAAETRVDRKIYIEISHLGLPGRLTTWAKMHLTLDEGRHLLDLPELQRD